MSGVHPRTKRRRQYRSDGVRRDSPEEIEHATHAEDLFKDLRDYFGIIPEKCVPTGDGKGYVRLTFDQVEALMYEPEEDR